MSNSRWANSDRSGRTMRPSRLHAEDSVTPLVILREVGMRTGESYLFRNVDLSILPGELIIVVGPNGSGKSTLLSLLTTSGTPDAGTVVRDALVTVFDPQPVVAGRPTEDVHQLLGGGGPKECAAQAAARFRFDPTVAINELSAGEVRRLEMAMVALSDASIVVMDEPTASLDSDGRDLLDAVLAEALESQRAVVVASTDPEFLLRHPEATLHILGRQ